MKQFFSLLLLVATSAQAQNPIIRDQFTADPTARVFNGKVYLYPSHDIPPCTPELIERQWFCMADYHVFSSDNLVDWTDHGVIVTQNEVPWVEPDSYSMWAPDCVEKNGKYYFYFPSSPRGKRGFGVGVAVADRPEGPFTPEAAPIEGLMGIDPCVLVDGNQSYIYWSGMGLRVARLKDNMLELDGVPQLCEGLPEGFKEGPFAFKREGKYYLTFPWVRGKKGEPGPDGKPLDNHTETLAYAMSDSPFGPWDFKGLIMEEWPNLCWTNHHSVVEFQGQWYLFYHHNDLSPQFDKNRSTCIDHLEFNPDGTIKQVKPTLRGVGVTNGHGRVQIDRYSAIGGGASIDYINKENAFQGWKTVFGKRGAWVRYDNVDFGTEPVRMVTVRAKSDTGAKLRINGKTVKLDKSNGWMVTAVAAELASGVHDVKVKLLSGSCEVDWVAFGEIIIE